MTTMNNIDERAVYAETTTAEIKHGQLSNHQALEECLDESYRDLHRNNNLIPTPHKRRGSSFTCVPSVLESSLSSSVSMFTSPETIRKLKLVEPTTTTPATVTTTASSLNSFDNNNNAECYVMSPPLTKKELRKNSIVTASTTLSSTTTTTTSIDHARVVVRLRSSRKSIWTVEDNVLQCTTATATTTTVPTYRFHNILDEQSNNIEAFEQVAQPVVESVLEGKNGTFLAYGTSDSGKTNTMFGCKGEAGIIELTAEQLCERLRVSLYRRKTSIGVKFFEIRNEKLFDLISDNEVEISEDRSSQVHTSQHEISNVDDVMKFLRKGVQKRSRSTCSHAIFQFTISSRTKSGELERRSELNLVDLANSDKRQISGNKRINQSLRTFSHVLNVTKLSNETTESAPKSNVGRRQGDRSLQHLSRIILALSLPLQNRPKQIDYHKSKLTQILQPHLYGNADLAILCCVSTAQQSIEDTKLSLRFASHAQRINILHHDDNNLETKPSLQKLHGKSILSTDQTKSSTDGSVSAEAAEANIPVDEVAYTTKYDPWNESDRTFLSQSSVSSFPIKEIIVNRPPPGPPPNRTQSLLDEEMEGHVQDHQNHIITSKVIQTKNLLVSRKQLAHIEQLNAEAATKEDLDLLMQQSIVLRFSLIALLYFIWNGQVELFAATILFAWLTLEVVTCP